MFILCAPLFYARARRRIPALWAGAEFSSFALAVRRGQSAAVRAEQLGGLRRQQRIATTWTWLSVVFSFRFFRPSLSLDLGVGRPPGRRGAKQENKAIANQSPLLGLFISNPDSKERLRVGNWIV